MRSVKSVAADSGPTIASVALVDVGGNAIDLDAVPLEPTPLGAVLVEMQQLFLQNLARLRVHRGERLIHQ